MFNYVQHLSDGVADADSNREKMYKAIDKLY